MNTNPTPRQRAINLIIQTIKNFKMLLATAHPHIFYNIATRKTIVCYKRWSEKLKRFVIKNPKQWKTTQAAPNYWNVLIKVGPVVGHWEQQGDTYIGFQKWVHPNNPAWTFVSKGIQEC